MVLALVAACDCDGGGDPLTANRAKIRVTPEAVSFGPVVVGASRAAPILIRNDGTWPLKLQSVVLDAAAGSGLRLEPNLAATSLAPSEQQTITVHLEPSGSAAVSGSVTIHSDDPERPIVRVPITAEGRRGPALDVCVTWNGATRCDLDAVDLGRVPDGATVTATITIASVGTDAVEVTAAGLRAPVPPTFSADTVPLGVLAPGDRRSIAVRYTARQDSLREAHFDVGSTDPAAATRTVRFTAAVARPALCLEPASLEFGSVAIGAAKTDVIRVKSCGEDDVSFTAATIGGGGAFTVVNPPSGVVLPKSGDVAYELSIRYAPTAAGPHVGTLTASSPLGSASAPLSGTTGGCDLAVSPRQLGLQAEPPFSATESVVVENVGGGDCTVTAVELVAGSSPDLSVAALALPLRLAPGGSELVPITFAPADFFDAEGTLVVRSDDPDEPEIDIYIEGFTSPPQGCQLQIDPRQVRFGVVPSGQRRVQGVSVENIGDADCTLTSAVLAPPQASLTVDASTAIGTIGAFEARIIAVTFAPTTVGRVASTLELDPGLGQTMIAVPVSGVAGAPSICVEPAALDFGPTQVRATRDIIVRACGTQPITVTALDWTTADPELVLSPPPSLPFTLAPGAVQAVTVVYQPADADGDTAVLTVRSNDPAAPAIDVRATGGPEIVPAAAGRFLYYWQIDNDGDIVRMPLQGQPVAEPYWGPRTGKECSGCHNLSPDGRYVAITEIGSGSSPALTFVDTRTDTAARTPNGVESAFFMSWNPDVATNPPYQYVYASQGDLHIASLYTGYIAPLAGADDPNYEETMPSWGPNGRIAFVRGADTVAGGMGLGGETDVLLVDEAGGIPAALAGASANLAANYYPAFSPNGRWIAITQSVSAESTISAGDAQLRLVAADGSGLVLPLSRANGTDGATSYATWAVDGSHLSFGSDRAGGQGGWDIYLAPIDPATGSDAAATAVPGANGPGFEHAAQWSP